MLEYVTPLLEIANPCKVRKWSQRRVDDDDGDDEDNVISTVDLYTVNLPGRQYLRCTQ